MDKTLCSKLELKNLIINHQFFVHYLSTQLFLSAQCFTELNDKFIVRDHYHLSMKYYQAKLGSAIWKALTCSTKSIHNHHDMKLHVILQEHPVHLNTSENILIIWTPFPNMKLTQCMDILDRLHKLMHKKVIQAMNGQFQQKQLS